MAPEDSQYLDKYSQNESANDEERNHIIVVGVGGGGSNAVDHMYRQGVEHVSFVVANTDKQALRESSVPNKLLLGPMTTRGRGAGGNPTVASKAGEESAAEIADIFDEDIDMVFVTAGMGGGTGTGAGPVVARIAKEKGLLTIGIVTIPFKFEGLRKIQKALDGAKEMSKYVDAIMVVNNERLVEIYPDFDFELAFAKADDVLSTAASSIAEIITRKGYINLDFNDVNATLREGNTAIIAVGYGEGENRVTKAIQDALHSPLLKNTDVFSSKRILFNLYYSRTAQTRFKASEAQELNDFIRRVEQEVDVIWGITYDETLGDKVKFTILASGFDVTVDEENGTVIESNAKGGEGEVNIQEISDVYGKDWVQNLERERETRNYILLDPDNLDDDSSIEAFDKEPTFARNRRKKTSGGAGEREAAASAPSAADDTDEFRITFGDDD